MTLATGGASLAPSAGPLLALAVAGVAAGAVQLAAPAVPRLGGSRLRAAVLILAGFGAVVTIVRGLPWVP